MLNTAGMSPVAAQFIRTYVTAMRQHYDTLKSVVEIMNPDNLGIRDFYSATQTAVALHEMQQDFDDDLRALQKKHKMRARTGSTSPTMDELADIFSLSFFKLITVKDSAKKQDADTPWHTGWFSGKPNEWKNTLATYQTTPKDAAPPLADLMSECLNAFMKLFKTQQDYLPPLHGKKIWPQNKYDLDDDMDDDDDSSPFDWLFDDNE